MSKPTENAVGKASAQERAVAEVLRRLANGEDLPSGWAFDASRTPPVFRFAPEELDTEPNAAH